ncbi:MAG: hypothetical protein ACRCVX_00050 [Shewanella sp.]
MARKPPISTVKGQVAMAAAVQAAPHEPLPHTPLRPVDRPYWDIIIKSRAHNEWSEIDLVLAHQLAQTQAEINSERALMSQEGAVVEGVMGKLVANPRSMIIDRAVKSEIALMRILQIHARAQNGEAHQVFSRREAHNQMAAEFQTHSDTDDLLAGAVH